MRLAYTLSSQVRIWNTFSQRAVGAPLSAGFSTVYAVAFSPDGTKMASGDWSGDVHLWPFPRDVRQSLCAKITTNMSQKQWSEWVSPDIGYRKQCPDLPTAQDDSTQ